MKKVKRSLRSRVRLVLLYVVFAMEVFAGTFEGAAHAASVCPNILDHFTSYDVHKSRVLSSRQVAVDAATGTLFEALASRDKFYQTKEGINILLILLKVRSVEALALDKETGTQKFKIRLSMSDSEIEYDVDVQSVGGLASASKISQGSFSGTYFNILKDYKTFH